VSIDYDDSDIKTYDLNARVSTDAYDGDVEEFLDNNYDNSTEIQTANIQLPTAMRVLVDYRKAKKWLVSAQADLSLVNSKKQQSNRIINTYTFMPRFESRWLTFLRPLVLENIMILPLAQA